MAESAVTESLVDVDYIQRHFDLPDFGFAHWLGIEILNVWGGGVEVQLTVRDDMSRPGGTVAGPVLMGIADAAMWGAVMTVHRQGNQSVTSDFTTHFLKRPDATILRCRATVIKPGRKIVVMRADVTCDDDPTIVCAFQASYALPPKPIIEA